MKKADLYLISILVTVALLLCLGYYQKYQKKGDVVRICIDNQDFKTLSLEKDCEYIIPTPGHHNTLVIKNGFAYISDADCPDKLCVHQKKISHVGETLVCLPHKVIVSIEGEPSNHESIDGTAY